MKKSMIDKLYNGEIYPAEQVTPQYPEYREASREYGICREKVASALGNEEEERMNQLEEKIHDYELKDTFVYGLRVGLLLILELLELEDTD